jgi:hypothetical protein
VSAATRRAAARLAALVLWLCLAAPALAQAPVKESRLVYGLSVHTGAEYASVIAPPAVETVYVLADRPSVLEPKRTEVYFWPITNEWRADLVAQNELVPGRLEVSQGGRALQTLELTDFVVQFDGDRLVGGPLCLAADAAAAWGRFEAERRAYVERERAYADAYQAFLLGLDELRRRAEAGARVEPPEPPARPEPFGLRSTEVGRGFALTLPPGQYDLRLRDAAGQVLPDSQKRLVAIAPRRAGVGYEVVPAEKWTFPETASDPGNAIYTVPGGVLYLRPFRAIELNALEHARLKNPQDRAATANRWTWVNVGPIEGAELVVRGGGAVHRQPLQPFAVEQVPGAALGYRVVPWAGGRSPDLVAYRLEAPAAGALELELSDANGAGQPGSARQVVANAGAPDWQLALPPLVPLALGITVALWRRERLQTVRSLPPDQRRLIA